MPPKCETQEKPETKPKRTSFLPRTRCTETERLAVEKKAAQSGLSLSEYQRRAILDCVVIEQKSILESKVVRELSAIGNNLNQLVRKTHIHDETDSQKMRDLLATIDRIIMGLVCDP